MIKLEVTLGAARPPRNGTPCLPLPPPEEVAVELGRTIKWCACCSSRILKNPFTLRNGSHPPCSLADSLSLSLSLTHTYTQRASVD